MAISLVPRTVKQRHRRHRRLVQRPQAGWHCSRPASAYRTGKRGLQCKDAERAFDRDAVLQPQRRWEGHRRLDPGLQHLLPTFGPGLSSIGSLRRQTHCNSQMPRNLTAPYSALMLNPFNRASKGLGLYKPRGKACVVDQLSIVSLKQWRARQDSNP